MCPALTDRHCAALSAQAYSGSDVITTVAKYAGGLLLLSEVPVVGQIRLVYQKIGQRKYPAEQEGVEEGLKEEGLHIVIVSNQTLIGLLMTYIT